MNNIFLKNKYSKVYYNIIRTAGSTPRVGYTEKHHIIPKCLGGDNSKENLVRLSAREHFVCHLLLTRMIDDPKKLMSLRFAVAKFRQSNSKQNRYILTSWEFEQVRIAQSLAARVLATTRKRAPLSKETKEKISAALKGKPSPLRGCQGSTKGRKLSEEHRRKISESQIGKKQNLSDDERLRRREYILSIRDQRIYKPLSEETKLKISNSNKGTPAHNKGVKASKYHCLHCARDVAGASNYTRWHGDRCRFKSESSK